MSSSSEIAALISTTIMLLQQLVTGGTRTSKTLSDAVVINKQYNFNKLLIHSG